ncbi:hypothetical protein [Alteribacillus sp. YIM 98480]|uniref:hypothetical protein n=1 Tax=Alteribacillus sp. YIM 98480 TaxID=2606599 RepID=UPI00131D3067|nr:hypothetical protein [Alteribacillus sp. YIM 98480]
MTKYITILVIALVLLLTMPSILHITAGETYYSSIIGGFISGSLTLAGVYITILHYKEKDFSALLPEKIALLTDLIEELRVHTINLQRYANDMNYNQKCVLVLKKDIKEHFLEQSLCISGNCYEEIVKCNTESFKLLTMLNQWIDIKYNKMSQLSEEHIAKYTESVKNIENSYNNVCEMKERVLEQYKKTNKV